MEYEHTPRQMAEKLMEFNRDFSDNEDDVKSETEYLIKLFDELQNSEQFNVLAHHLDIMMAHKLMTMDGWKVFGYHADNSDMMTDYYDPAYWNGIATKNGYTLVVNCSSEAKPEEVRKYNYDGTFQDRSISEKIVKLEQMTMERGASEQEEESAKKMIEKLRSKARL